MKRTFKVTSRNTLRCRGWRQEGLLRLLENVLAVGEDPDNLVVYAALGKAARNWQAHDTIVDALMNMDEEDTLVVQSGKPIGLVRTHADAPIVIMANCNIVGRWATPEVFYELQSKGLICWGGLTAGDWQYIGSQGVIQGTYEIFMRIAAQYFEGSLAGRFILTAGLGGMGGAQPLAGRLAGAAILCVDVDPERIAKRKAIGYLDIAAATLEEALAEINAARGQKRAVSVGITGNAAEIFPEILCRGIVPDVVTDQTSAHDLVYGYVPATRTLKEARAMRESDPVRLMAESRASICRHVEAMLGFQEKGAIVFDNGNLIRSQALDGGVENPFKIPIFTEAFLRPLFCRGIGPFRWISLSNSPTDIARIDDLLLSMFTDNKIFGELDSPCSQACAFRGLAGAHRLAWPSRAHRLGARCECARRSRRTQRAHCIHARSSRCRRNDASENHDGEHARRIGRHLRLAASRRHDAVLIESRSRRYPLGRGRVFRLYDERRCHAGRRRIGGVGVASLIVPD